MVHLINQSMILNTFSKGDNMAKCFVFTFLMILRPLVYITFKSLINLMCLLGDLAKCLCKSLCKEILQVMQKVLEIVYD